MECVAIGSFGDIADFLGVLERGPVTGTLVVGDFFSLLRVSKALIDGVQPPQQRDYCVMVHLDYSLKGRSWKAGCWRNAQGR